MNIGLHSTTPITITSPYSQATSSADEAQRDSLGKNNEQESVEKNPQKLSQDELRMVQDLQARDSEVRAHEAAHQAAGGGMTGGASYTYQQGPDGKMYAIGGEVSISTKGSSDPQEALANARVVAAAAMAPANPSPQDYSVASSARVMEMKAQQQIAKERVDEITGRESYTKVADENSQEQEPQESIDIFA